MGRCVCGTACLYRDHSTGNNTQKIIIDTIEIVQYNVNTLSKYVE